MKRILTIVCCLAATVACMAVGKVKADKDTEQFRYEIECAGNGAQGSYLVRVWTYTKNAKSSNAINQCKKNAVHGIIFKGYTGGNGCVAQRPLAATPGVEAEHAEYFKQFFADGGEFLKYVQVTDGTQETVKFGREYKVGVVVTVAKDALRKALEQAGIIRSLGSGF